MWGIPQQIRCASCLKGHWNEKNTELRHLQLLDIIPDFLWRATDICKPLGVSEFIIIEQSQLEPVAAGLGPLVPAQGVISCSLSGPCFLLLRMR